MPENVISNKNFRTDVTVVTEMPDLDRMGKAGRRLKLERLLLSPHGLSASEQAVLDPEDCEILRMIAREGDPEHGVSQQLAAIGVLGAIQDKSSLLQLSELAQNPRADLRIQIAATHALGEIGDEQARPVLLRSLKSKKAEVCAQAAIALAKISNPADITALESVANRNKTFAGNVAGEMADTIRARFQL